MHLFVWFRGEHWAVQQLKNWIQTRTCYIPFINKEGKQMYQPLSLGLRDSILGIYEIIFPEEDKDFIFSFLEVNRPFMHHTFSMSKKVNVAFAFLRTILGLKKLPKFNQKTRPELVQRGFFLPDELLNFVNIIPIGIKHDWKNQKMADGTTHEFL